MFDGESPFSDFLGDRFVLCLNRTVNFTGTYIVITNELTKTTCFFYLSAEKRNRK